MSNRWMHSAIALSLLMLAPGVRASESETRTTQFKTPQAQVTVRWGQAYVAPAGEAPAFDQLDADRNGRVDRVEASAYRALDEEYELADRDRNDGVTAAEYARWLKL